MIDHAATRLILVGESTPRHAPGNVLLDRPSHSPGGRLRRIVLGVDPDEYYRHERLCLLVAANHWSSSRARKAAEAILAAHLAGVIVLLGGKVRDAFGLAGAKFFDVIRDGARTFVLLPHPAEGNLFWLEPQCVPRCRAALREAAPGVVLGGL